ncbi:MAG: trimethylamine methyltransferase family protein [Bacteroidota bacterium]
MRFEYVVLEEKEILQIHESSLRVLKDIGMKVLDPKLCQELAKKGLIVNEKEQLIKFPSDIVEWAIKVSPKSFSMYDHKGGEIELKTGNTLPAVYSGGIKVWDWQTGEIRSSTLTDLNTCLKLADAMDEIKVNCPVCIPNDSPEEDKTIYAASLTLQNSAKLTEAAPHDVKEAKFWIEASAIAGQGRDFSKGPSVLFTVSPTSPLQICQPVSQIISYLTRQNSALLISSCPLAGVSSPFTMAGNAVQTHAEFLGILTIAQLLKEGIPCVYGGSAGPVDLRTGGLSYGVAERNNMLSANIDIANYFGFSHFSAAGSVDSWSPDWQAGQSKALTWMTRLMKGSTLGLWFGSLMTGTTVSPEQIILDADLYRSVASMLGGFTVDEDKLAYEAIKRVGPGGSYLMDEHTLQFMNGNEIFHSPIVNNEGLLGKSMVDRAHDSVEQIINNHESSVSEEIRDQIEKFYKDYTKARG